MNYHLEILTRITMALKSLQINSVDKRCFKQQDQELILENLETVKKSLKTIHKCL